ncbi:hypothetical protein, partial [Streptomyces zingiberis]
AYVPVDPGWPAERVGRVLADAGVSAVLCSGATKESVPEGNSAPVVVLDDPAVMSALGSSDAGVETAVT